jgi:hypothetical protein
MPRKYEYETSPRKLAPDYMPTKKPKVPKKETVKKLEASKKETVKKAIRPSASRKQKAKMIFYIVIGFLILFAVSFRNSQIDENFARLQDLKKELSELEKQNGQLEISIANKVNLTNIEEQAKELLGMQKLNSKQTKYVSLPKTDYIETAAESVVIEEKEPLYKSIINGIMNIFK